MASKKNECIHCDDTEMHYTTCMVCERMNIEIINDMAPETCDDCIITGRHN